LSSWDERKEEKNKNIAEKGRPPFTTPRNRNRTKKDTLHTSGGVRMQNKHWGTPSCKKTRDVF